METVLEQLTHQRINLDRIFKSLEEGSKMPLMAHTAKLAFMWLGKAKGAVGSANPYPNSTDPSNKTIEKAVDLYEGDIIANTDEIEFLKTMRKELGDVEHAIRHGLFPYLSNNRIYQLSIEQAYKYACEVKMYLGLILGEIRDKQETEAPVIPLPPPQTQDPKEIVEEQPTPTTELRPPTMESPLAEPEMANGPGPDAEQPSTQPDPAIEKPSDGQEAKAIDPENKATSEAKPKGKSKTK